MIRSHLRSVIWKEFLHIFRDKRSLFMIIFMPALQLMIYGFAVSNDVKHLPTVVFNHDGHTLSRNLVQAFKNSTYFDIKYYAYDRHYAENLLDKAKVKVILEIPPDFSRKLKANLPNIVHVTIDGSEPNAANTALSMASSVCSDFGAKLLPRRRNVGGPLVETRAHMNYNPQLRSANFMIPGVIGFILQALIPILTATALVREKEQGTFEVLITTPIRPYEIILGKLIPFAILAFAEVVAIILLGSLIFKVDVAGNFFLLLAVSFLFLMGSLCLGLFVSSIAQNQNQAFQMMTPIFPFSFLLSGFIFPRENMPLILNWIGNLVPLTFFLQALRGIILKGVGAAILWPQIFALGVYAMVFVTLSMMRFKKTL